MGIINRTPRITYLIDSENVSDAWIRLLPELKKRDRIVVFYTENTSNLAADSVRMITEYKKYDITWEKCFTGNNALDFQLVSRLGFYICQEPGDEYVIMSNDTGYDPAIKYWVQAGYTLKRIPGHTGKSSRKEPKRLLPGSARNYKKVRKPTVKKAAPIKASMPSVERREELPKMEEKEPSILQMERKEIPLLSGEQEEILASSEPKKEETASPDSASLSQNTDSEPQIPVECVLKLCRSIPIHKPNWLHEALVALLGAEDGREVYYFLKDNQEFHDKFTDLYIKEKNDRIDNYIQAVLLGHHLEPFDSEELRNVLFQCAPNNFSGIYRKMIETFGKEMGPQYYTALKPHIRMIRRM